MALVKAKENTHTNPRANLSPAGNLVIERVTILAGESESSPILLEGMELVSVQLDAMEATTDALQVFGSNVFRTDEFDDDEEATTWKAVNQDVAGTSVPVEIPFAAAEFSEIVKPGVDIRITGVRWIRLITTVAGVKIDQVAAKTLYVAFRKAL